MIQNKDQRDSSYSEPKSHDYVEKHDEQLVPKNNDTQTFTSTMPSLDGKPGQGEYDLIHRDLEKIADSEVFPQKRIFSIFYPKKIPDIPQTDEERKTIPLKTWNLLSTVLFTWCFTVIKTGYRRTVQPNDLMKLDQENHVEETYQKFMAYWDESMERKRKRVETNKKPPKYDKYSIVLVLFKTFKFRYTYAIFSMIICNLAVAFTPLLSKYLIAFVAEKQVNPDLKINKGAGYAIGTVVLLIFNALFQSQGMFNGYFVGCHVRSVLTKALLEKSFRLSSKGKHDFPLSKITTMATADTNRIELGFAFHPMLWGFPGAFIVTVYLLIHNIGPIALVGLGFFVLSMGITLYGFTYVMKYRIIANKYTDARVSFVAEIVNSLKIIKFYAWENAYLKLIGEKRIKEMQQIKKMQFYTAFVISYSVVVPTIASLITFLCLYEIRGSNHSAAVVFSSLSLFHVLSGQMFIIPEVMSTSINGIVGLGRVQGCLCAEEIQEDKEVDIPCINEKNALELENCSYEWEIFADDEKDTKDKSKDKDEDEDEDDVNSDDMDTHNNGDTVDGAGDANDAQNNQTTSCAFKGLNDLNLEIKKGEFVVVTGAIGTGKSSFLLALTHLMKQTSGESRQTGSSLLCGQPWVQNATIRDNILFGSDYHKDAYERVLDICCLNADLDILPARDYTEIGERGITLSGGQKARINLARTMYRAADIYLFDDILSAVDAKVGKDIMEKCILGALGGKTRVLATHQLNLIKDADRVVFLSTDGSFSIDTMDNLMVQQGEFANLISNAATSKSDEKDEETSIDDDNTMTKPLIGEGVVGSNSGLDTGRSPAKEGLDIKEAIAQGQLIDKEERAINSIGFKVYKSYFIAGAGAFWLLFMAGYIFVDIFNTFLDLFTSVWLSFWNEMRWKKPKEFYMGLYALWSFLSFFCIFGACLMILGVGLKASKKLHNGAIKNVLHAPMAFVDVTPLGRILNRFTKDMDILDTQLPFSIVMAVYSLFAIFGIIIMCVIYIPWFAIALPVFAFFYILIADHYQSTAREVKRLEAVQRSFVFNNFSEVLSGINTIKSYKLSGVFFQKGDFLTNRLNEATVLYIGLQRWSTVWSVFIGVCFTLIIAFLCITRAFSIGAASTGLLLNYTLELSNALTQLLFETTQLENYMNSAERVVSYSEDLPQEQPYTIAEMKPADSWPEKANISFENVSLAYRPGLPLVLKNVTIDIKGGEKIGICGRTGAGKSTIMSALYRIVELSAGRVVIDGVDISKIGLYDLRSKLSIIPQEPVLFKGNIQRNLDPFGNATDDQLWDALVKGGAIDSSEIEAVKRQTVVKGEKNNDVHRFHLYQSVASDGANFSLGERQLLTLARALVRGSKILVLDEATSSVDYETDAKIQSKIAEGFAESTILCIAHRLKTIINYDKILVLEKGEVAEYDAPLTLFKQEGGIFRDMCMRSGISEADFC